MYELLNLPNLWWVLFGSAILGATLGVVGACTFLKKESLVGDVLSHAALPGVTSAFLILDSRHPAIILLGALLACLISNLLLKYISHTTRLKSDTILALLLSTFFSIGMFQLSLIQQSGTQNSAGLDRLLFGQASAIGYDELLFYSLVSFILLFSFYFFSRQIIATIFDSQAALIMGLSVRNYQLYLSLAVATAIAVSLDLAGVVLVSAMLITPAAAARFWSRSVSSMLLISALMGGASGLLGAAISATRASMPTGPWIVVVVTVIFLTSMYFAPQTGIYSRQIRRKKIGTVIDKENVLRTIYNAIENHGITLGIAKDLISKERNITGKKLEKILFSLRKDGFIRFEEEIIYLTEIGLRVAEKLTRYHRLWELYLAKHVPLPETHLHADAEEAEHFLDEHLAEALAVSLSDPQTDPHGKPIPN